MSATGCHCFDLCENTLQGLLTNQMAISYNEMKSRSDTLKKCGSNSLAGISFNRSHVQACKHIAGLPSDDLPMRTSTWGKYVHCTAMFVHLQWNRSGATLVITYDNVYTTPVPYDINTKKHGIGCTQHRQGAFKFVYVLSGKQSTTALRFWHTFPGHCC